MPPERQRAVTRPMSSRMRRTIKDFFVLAKTMPATLRSAYPRRRATAEKQKRPMARAMSMELPVVRQTAMETRNTVSAMRRSIGTVFFLLAK